MPSLSDLIEEFIKRMLNESADDELEIQRNELAAHFKCAPSQINYVLMTRFDVGKGYYIESRRGGGGSIRIMRVSLDANEYLSGLVSEKIGDSVSQSIAEAYINSFQEQGLINSNEAALMKAAVNDRAIVSQSMDRDSIRAGILKSMVIVLLNL
jgi:transcriptional regulator CtsR